MSRVNSSPSTAFTHRSFGSFGSTPRQMKTTKFPSGDKLAIPSAPGNDVTVRSRSGGGFDVARRQPIEIASDAQTPSTTIAAPTDQARDRDVTAGAMASTAVAGT